MLEISLGNLLAWALQVAALVVAGVVLPGLLRMTSPRPRLTYLRVVLVICLALPLLQPWAPASPKPLPTVMAGLATGIAPASTIDDATAAGADATGGRGDGRSWPDWRRWPLGTIAVAIFAAGLALRLAWLALGLASLARLRRSSVPLDPRPDAVDDAALMVGVDADFRVSARVVRPVTFGLRRPVVLVPPDFVAFTPTQQTAVAAHELLHVARRDWVRTLGDELILSVLWFHPALWWLVDQIHLHVEQVVDRDVVRVVGARKPYLEALLKLAAAGPTPMLQPASLFLKHGHLAQRVALLVREVSMSRVRLVGSFVVVVAVLAAGGWYVVQAIPLRAAADSVALPEAQDSAAVGASLVTQEAKALLPTPLPPPPSPSQQPKPVVSPKAQASKPGAIPVLDGSLASYVALARTYEDAGDLKNAEKTYLELTKARPKDPGAFLNLAGYYNRRGDFAKTVAALTQRVAIEPSNPEGPYTLATYYWEKAYRGTALSDGQKAAYIAAGLSNVDKALQLKPEYLEALTYKNLLLRLQANLESDPDAQKALIAEADKLRDQAIKIRESQNKWDAVPANAVRVGGGIQPPTKVKDAKPVYPEVASEARVQGVVIVEAVISPEGRVQATRVLRSIPLLDQAALDAVNQWEFTPTTVNGAPIPVVMTVTVNFTMAGGSGVVGGVGGGVAGGVAGGAVGGVTAGSGFDVPPPPPPPPPGSSSSGKTSLDPTALKVGGAISPPKRLVNVNPVYPPEASEARVQGVVILEVLIGTDGKVENSRILRSIPMLDQAATDAVRQWMFTVTSVNSAPVKVVMTVTVNFTLQ